MTNVNLHLLLAKIAEDMADIPVHVVIVRRDEGMSTTHKAVVPIERVSPNFDGGGVKIYIEESQIKFEEFR